MATRGSRTPAPTLTEERLLWDRGHASVVGVDEVGRGSWAGPLTVVAVVLPHDRRVNGIRDSKLLSPRRRSVLRDRILEWCVDHGVGHASAEECDELGMSDAQRLATRRAFDRLRIGVDAVLADGRWNFVSGVAGDAPTQMIVKGDRVSLSIAAASVVAKVTRDEMLIAAADDFPAFNFDSNKGYPCPRHRMALDGYGPTSIHRRSWAFMDNLVWSGCHRTTPVASGDNVEPATGTAVPLPFGESSES